MRTAPLLALLVGLPVVVLLVVNAERDTPEPEPDPALAAYEAREQAARERRIAAMEARAEQARAEEQLPDDPPPTTTSPDQSTARTVAAGVSGGLDSPMDLILPQIPYSPDLNRSGRYREFTYRFEDGSRLVLTAVPAGGQSGLVLHSVDIQE